MASSAARLTRWRRSVTSSAAARASATSVGFNACNSLSATAVSTVAAAMDRQVGAARALIGGSRIGVVVGAHRFAAGPAGDDALTQRGPLPRWPRPGIGAISGQLGPVGQVVAPGDVAGVVIVDQHGPLGAGSLE